MKLNHDTSLEPHFYEAVQELVDEMNHATFSARKLYQARLNGMFSALHALTGQIWTIAVERIDGKNAIFARNEADDERVIPTWLYARKE